MGQQDNRTIDNGKTGQRVKVTIGQKDKRTKDKRQKTKDKRQKTKRQKDKKTKRQKDKLTKRLWSLEYSIFDVTLLLLFAWDSLKTYI